MINYCVVVENSLKNLQAEVETKSLSGWRPQGGFFMTRYLFWGRRYYQAMVKETVPVRMEKNG